MTEVMVGVLIGLVAGYLLGVAACAKTAVEAIDRAFDEWERENRR